ncbi:MAG: flagellar export protein FliJ [Carboxydocellales bacterium]
MKVFRFRLQTSLNVRYRQEEQQKLVLKEKINHHEESIIELNQILARLENNYNRIRQLQLGNLNIRELEASNDFVIMLTAQVEQQKLEVEYRRKEVEDAREKLLEIVKARKILEKLKEKHFEEYRLEMLREEQRVIDEMAARGTRVW